MKKKEKVNKITKTGQKAVLRIKHEYQSGEGNVSEKNQQDNQKSNRNNKKREKSKKAF